MGKPIYVEIAIRAPLEELWRHTQSPDLHRRWDLRFTRIAYLPRPDPLRPQRFLYASDAVPRHVRPVREERRE
jgi:hypothetical protein